MSGPTIIDVGTEAELNQALATVDAATAGSYDITFTASITEGTDTGTSITYGTQTLSAPAGLYALNLTNGVSVTIDGGAYTLDGNGLYQGLFIYQGDVSVENLTISDAVAQGGAAGTGGGGGAGLGGGLFVAGTNSIDGSVTTGGTVTLQSVTFTDDSAVGGAGSTPFATTSGPSGGGGGLGGAGGSAHNGGGGGGIGGAGGGYKDGETADGGPGLVLGAAGGGSAFGGSSGGASGGGGGGGVAAASSGGGGGGVGGADGAVYLGGLGGFGGGGGGDGYTGGGGGFGGGGGAGWTGGGGGGFGGGGGGAFPGGHAGLGGFGGGAGYAGNSTSAGGGGGLGAGGDIFVQQGGSLTIEGGTLNPGTITGGAGGGSGGSGSAYGDGIFIQDGTQGSTQGVTLAATAGAPLTVYGVITDENGAASSTSYGAGGLTITGTGTITLDPTSGPNTYTGGTTIESGTLLLGAAGAAGSGDITFGTGDPPVLAFALADAPTNAIAGFDSGDAIDITNLGTADITSFNFDSGTDVLAIGYTGDAGTPLDLQFTSGAAGDSFHYIPDGGDGTLIVCYYPGTAIRTPSGDVAVECLRIGDRVMLAGGGVLPVRWIGHNTVSTRFADPLRVLPIRIRAGALAQGLPERDLLVSPEHAVLVEDILVQAGALVNGVSIIRERNVPETFTYYHVELAEHALLLAEGLAAESFVDNVHRMAFDNWAEHAALYGDAPVTEMPYPRAQSRRQVPAEIHALLLARARDCFGPAAERAA